jgi:hypothetical protein
LRHATERGKKEKIRDKLVSSLIYIVSYLCGKSPCLTTTPDWKIFDLGNLDSYVVSRGFWESVGGGMGSSECGIGR